MNKAILIIDAQRGFMPASEGEKLGLDGFGELPVQHGETTVNPVNRLLGMAATLGFETATTQDWHPYETAHFTDEGVEPNFTTTWPRHCVAGTPGAELHPEIKLPRGTRRFTKGSEHLTRGEDDLSYSGYYAEDPTTGHTLPEWLKARNITEIVLGGLALDYCVGKTALDLRQKLAVDVTLALDATAPVAPETGQAMLRQLITSGVHLATTDELLTKYLPADA